MEINGITAEDLDALAAKAESACSSGDWATAVAAYEALVRTYPKQVDLKYQLANAYEEAGRVHDAIAVLTDPSIADREKSKRRLAKAYLTVGDYDAASPLLDELIAAFPDIPKFVTWRATCDERRIATRLQQGEELVSANRLDEAEQVYLQLAASFPEAGRAHLRLGQFYAQRKRWADAIPPLRAALRMDAKNRKLKTTLARAYFKAGERAEAAALLETVDGIENDVDNLLLLQRCRMELQDWARAEQLAARLLAILSPDDPLRESVAILKEDALVSKEAGRIDAITQSGGLDRVIEAYSDLADRHPNAVVAWVKLGNALLEADRDATVAFRAAARLRPDDRKIREKLTRAVVKAAEEQDVLRYVQDAIADGTADAECHRWIANYHSKRYEWQPALESARNALALNPSLASARLLLARTLMHLGRLSEALDELDFLQALGTSPVPLQLKADIFIRLARLDDAIDLYREALEQEPAHPLTNHRLSYALLLKGDIAGFHRFHEHRRKGKAFLANNKEYPFLDWNGELGIEGKLLVWAEFGLGVGQNILHMTFLRRLAALGLDVVLEVEPRLVDLCRRSFPGIIVVPNTDELPAGISHHTPIGSLSRWFTTDLESFSSLGPFFVPDVQAVAAHRERLRRAAGEGQLLVGVSWSSNNPFVGGNKSIALDQLLQTIAIPGVTLVNLQYGDHAQLIALAEAATGKRLMDSGIDNTNDLDGLSAVVAAMDLVVCIGHTTAHMTGAVGTPNFVLVPSAPFPHWLAKGKQCIWYPATTLFRQAPVDDGWERALARVGMAVREFANAYTTDSWLTGTLIQGLRPPATSAGQLSPREMRDAVSAFAAEGAYRSALELIDRLPSECGSRELEMQRGELLALTGRWSEARAIYVALRPAEGVDPEIERQILSVSLTMYDLDYALPIALRLADEDADCRMTAARILYRLRRHEEAVAELRKLSLQAPQIDGLGSLLGAILLEAGEYERAEAYLAEQTAMTRRTEDYTLLGRSLSAQGRHDEALAAYDKGLALLPNDPAANFWRTQERVKLGLAPSVPLPPLQGDVPEVAPDDLVIFFGADNSYFWEHGLVLLGSLGAHSPRARCHVHVINPDAGVGSAIDVIRGELPGLRLSYSYEHVDLDACDKAHVRTYYASVRFVRLAEIFARSPASYLCLDTDSIVRGDVETRSSPCETADVAFRVRFDERLHMSLVASASMLCPTPAAAEFINRVSTLIKDVLEAGEAKWFLDQVVLSHCLREMSDGAVRVSLLDMTYLDWFFRDDSLIWTGKGKRKSDDNRYREELSKYRYLQEHDKIRPLMPQIIEDPAGQVDVLAA